MWGSWWITPFFSSFNYVYIERIKKTEIPFKPVRSCLLKMMQRFLMPRQRKAKTLYLCSALKSLSPHALHSSSSSMLCPFVPLLSSPCHMGFTTPWTLTWSLFFPCLLSHMRMACSPFTEENSVVSVLIELEMREKLSTEWISKHDTIIKYD